MGGDKPLFYCITFFILFQSTPPVWVVTNGSWMVYKGCDRISIHTTRVGGDDANKLAVAGYTISIHTTRVGGDWEFLDNGLKLTISIHTTRVGGDSQYT